MTENSEHKMDEALIHTEKSLFKVCLGGKVKENFNYGSSARTENDNYQLQIVSSVFQVSRDLLLCCLASSSQCFEGVHCFHLQGLKVHEDQGQEPPTQ
jgi:hypothetical protein